MGIPSVGKTGVSLGSAAFPLTAWLEYMKPTTASPLRRESSGVLVSNRIIFGLRAKSFSRASATLTGSVSLYS